MKLFTYNFFEENWRKFKSPYILYLKSSMNNILHKVLWIYCMYVESLWNNSFQCFFLFKQGKSPFHMWFLFFNNYAGVYLIIRNKGYTKNKVFNRFSNFVAMNLWDGPIYKIYITSIYYINLFNSRLSLFILFIFIFKSAN